MRFFLALAAFCPLLAQFTLESVRSYPFPNELAAAATGSRIAWVFNQQGRRDVWVTQGPEFRARRLTNFQIDDGQDLTNVALSHDGSRVVFVRGGEHGANWDRSLPVNPTSSPKPAVVQIFSIAFEGGALKLLAEGDLPVVSPDSTRVAFVKDRGVWTVPIDGSAPAKRLFTARGENGDPQWSPDGKRLAFVSNRGDHSFIGVFQSEADPIVWLAPSTSRDASPRWSPDGLRVAFTRAAGGGGSPRPLLTATPRPWSVWTADAFTGEGKRVWASGNGLRDSPPTTHGGTNLHWAAKGRIVFASYSDGWPHLYSIPETGGPAIDLTPGNFMVEYVSLAPSGEVLFATANAGSTKDDIDRRHILKIPVDRAAPVVLTPGTGLEWTPFVTGDGKHVAFLGATARRPPFPMIVPFDGGEARVLAGEVLPASFPTAQLVTPKSIQFKASDGGPVYGQLFEKAGGTAKKPALVYVHGGPMRQMLAGWHMSDYYSNAYAMNQYFASRGYVVLSVNYRLGIGYGFDFHQPPNAGTRGASEYLDVKAAGEYLKALPQVDPKRIGVYGGSYGGYLTALALGKDSSLFAAGVDIHGVHDRTMSAPIGYEKPPDWEKAVEVSWKSSPVAYLSTWKSPVLLIHADDDRNVRFSQTVDLVQRLREHGVRYEEIVIPDDTHHFFRFANLSRVASATAAFLDRELGVK